MIQKINFSGRVHYVGNTKELSSNKKDERKKLQEYANKTNCDLVVLDRDYYSDGTGIYRTLKVTECKDTGRNMGQKLTFDFLRETAKNEGKPFYLYKI